MIRMKLPLVQMSIVKNLTRPLLSMGFLFIYETVQLTTKIDKIGSARVSPTNDYFISVKNVANKSITSVLSRCDKISQHCKASHITTAKS
jgi:hypothetical protein